MTDVNMIEEQLGSIYRIDDEACPRTYIFPDGKYLHLNSYTSHNYVKIDLQNKYGYSEDESQIENYGVIRVNMDSEGFVALSKIPQPNANTQLSGRSSTNAGGRGRGDTVSSCSLSLKETRMGII